jgi:molybdopterin converting factor small subunit
MKVNVQIAGLIDGDTVHGERDIELKEGSTVDELIKRADKDFKFKKQYFKLLLKQGRLPTILINGDRLDLPEGYSMVLKEGDKVSVILPMSGG